MNPETRTYDKHWMPWLKKELLARGIPAETPLMPSPWEPNYEAFKGEFEKSSVSEDDVLVGHSCGTTFLLRWLAETRTKVSKLILVAPWKITDKDDEARKMFYEYPIDKTIQTRIGEIILFTADNEAENGKKSAKIILDAVGGKVIELKGRGHYVLRDMKTEEFPELLAEILR